MVHRVIKTRVRVIEEEITTEVMAPSGKEASVMTNHMLDCGMIQWKYKNTLGETIPKTQITTKETNE